MNENRTPAQIFQEQASGSTERRWPKGRLNGDDDGESAMRIGIDATNKIIQIEFPKPTHWFGLDIETAKNIRDILDANIKRLEDLK